MFTGAGWVLLGDADSDGDTVQRYLPSGAGPTPALGGEEAKAGDVAGDDGTSNCQSPRHGRHRHDSLCSARRADHLTTAGVRSTLTSHHATI